MLDFVRDGRVDYDRLCLMNLRTETRPPRALRAGRGHPAAAQMGAHPGRRRLHRMALRRRAGRRCRYRALVGGDAADRGENFEDARRMTSSRNCGHIAEATRFESGRLADCARPRDRYDAASLPPRTVRPKPAVAYTSTMAAAERHVVALLAPGERGS